MTPRGGGGPVVHVTLTIPGAPEQSYGLSLHLGQLLRDAASGRSRDRAVEVAQSSRGARARATVRVGVGKP
jgi:hypothetical protein